MENEAPTSQCPRCGKSVIWNQTFPDRPFCSERCKLIDLGAWLTEAHRIPDEEEEKDPGAIADWTDD